MIPSMRAWRSIVESSDCLNIVSGELRRLRIGASRSSAECSKNAMTVLSMPRMSSTQASGLLILPAVRKIDTCSALTARLFFDKREFLSIYSARSWL
jgi:hypothetical protein